MPPTHVVSYDQRERQTDEGGRGREGLDGRLDTFSTHARSVGRSVVLFVQETRDLSLSPPSLHYTTLTTVVTPLSRSVYRCCFLPSFLPSCI